MTTSNPSLFSQYGENYPETGAHQFGDAASMFVPTPARVVKGANAMANGGKLGVKACDCIVKGGKKAATKASKTKGIPIKRKKKKSRQKIDDENYQFYFLGYV
jgi:hypothetical protein